MNTPKRILFLDLSCPKPYDAETLQTQPQGGTESTVTRVAEELATRGYEVHVAQHNREAQDTTAQGKANYISLDALDQMTGAPHAIVALRTPKLLPFARNTFGSDPKLFLWCHDFNHQELVQDYPVMEEARVKILGVSRTHKQIISDALLSQVKDVKNVTVDSVYNPIADELKPDATPVEQKRLVYFSSPHKGLEHTLMMFKRLRALDSSYTLSIANPGYLKSEMQLPEGVTNLGELSHPEVIQHVRGAFAVFHMNQYPETFGLVYAEALAVGTPVLTSPVAAVHEIVSDAEFFVDVKDERKVWERLRKWQDNQRPTTKLRQELRMSSVIKKWEGLLG